MRTSTKTAALAALGLCALAGCARDVPPIRVDYVPEAPCARYARGTCDAKAPEPPRRIEWYDPRRYLPE